MPEVRTCLDPAARNDAWAIGHPVPVGNRRGQSARLLARLFLGMLALGSCARQGQPVDASVVEIVVPEGRGAGFALNQDGDVVTAFHVIEGFAAHPDQITVVETYPKAGRRHPVKQIPWISRELDLAVVHVDGLDQPPAPLPASEPRTGDAVYAVGFRYRPSDRGAAAAELTVFGGTVTRITGEFADQGTGPGPSATPGVRIIQHSATFDPGNSGAPLVNACGAVVGINTAGGLPMAETRVGATRRSTATIHRASYAIDVSALIAALDRLEIPYQPAGTDCRGSPGRLRTLLVTGLVLAVLAVLLLSPRRGGRTPASNSSGGWMLSGVARDGQAIRIAVHKTDLAGTRGGLTIGRDPRRCQIVIDDPTVSGRHVRLSMAAAAGADRGDFLVEDLRSTNGTFVDGKRVPPGPDEAVPLQAGATLVLGACRMRLIHG